MSAPIQIKKVKAFPISANIKLANGTSTAQIVKLTQHAFLAETSATNLQPGEKFEVSFELPVLHHLITENCTVMKVYTTWGGSTNVSGEGGAPAAAQPPVNSAQKTSGGKALYLIEGHFLGGSQTTRDKIYSFLKALAKS